MPLSICKGQGPELYFKKIPPTELSTSQVFDIIQDSIGFMWFATRNGLKKFDGHRILHFNPSNKLIGYNRFEIRELCLDRSGKFWLGTAGHGLYIFYPETEEFRVVPWSLRTFSESPLFILSIFEDSGGIFWVGSLDHGLFAFDPRTGSVKNYTSHSSHAEEEFSHKHLSHKSVWAIWEDKEGMIWAKTEDLVLNRINPKSDDIIQYTTPRFLGLGEEARMDLIRKDQFNRIWIVEINGRFSVWNPMNGDVQSLPTPAISKEEFNERRTKHIHRDREGNFWIGVGAKGLFRWDQSQNQWYNYRHFPRDHNGIARGNVHVIYEGEDGVIWLGMSQSGVTYFNPSSEKIQFYPHDPRDENSISSNNIRCLFEDSRGTVWAGTGGEGLNQQISANVWKRQVFAMDDWRRRSRSIYESPSNPGVIWVGYYNQGLESWDLRTNRRTQFKHDANNEYSLSNNHVSQIVEDHRGFFWLATHSGLNCFDPKTENFSRFYHVPDDTSSLTNNFITFIYEDRQGLLWVGTNQGLHCLKEDRNSFKRIPFGSDFGMDIRINDIYEDSQERFWISTPVGLFLLDRINVTLKNYSFQDFDPKDVYWQEHNNILCMLEDDFGNLWLGTERGIVVLQLDVDSIKVHQYYEMINNRFLGHTRPYAKIKSGDGKLYFTTTVGLVSFIPSEDKPLDKPSPMVITDLKILNHSVFRDPKDRLYLTEDGSQGITISSRDKMITFQYAMLEYASSSQNLYAYKLEGFDQNWNYVGTNDQATYTNLSPGMYTFHVRGRNSKGTWSTNSTTFQLFVEPTFIQNKWVRGGGVLLFISGIAFYFTRRNRRIRQQNMKLQQAVDDQTKDLSQTLSNLKNTQSELLAAERMAVLGRLVANISHEINTPLGAVDASNRNLNDAFQFMLHELPTIFQKLTREETRLFFELVQENEGSNYISFQKRRAMQGMMQQSLATLGFDNPGALAQSLNQIGILIRDLSPYVSLLKHPDSEKILSGIHALNSWNNNHKNINVAIQRSSSILQALRKYMTGIKSADKQIIDVTDSIQTILTLYRNQFIEGIKIIKDFRPVPKVLGNHMELSQVWTNLLINAMQAMDYQGNLEVVIRFTDDGHGISPEIQDRIFEPFFTTKTNTKGSGLGLDITRRIVEDHKGYISFESQPGNTSFDIFLPVDVTAKVTTS